MRKRTRKLSAILLTAIMIFATMAIPVSATVDQVFKDVPESAWYYGYVMMLYEKGIVGGYGTSGEFRPNIKLTRDQAAKMIARAAGLPYKGKKADFPDVDPDGEMSPYIAALVDAGATQGFPDGTFRPKANIKRGHAAKMVGLAFGLKEGEMTQALTDLPADAGVATAIEILASNGIVKGYKGSQDFKPNEEISRAEISKIICIAMVVTAVQKAEDEPSPENLEAAQDLIEDLPPEQGDSATLDYLTERLEVLGVGVSAFIEDATPQVIAVKLSRDVPGLAKANFAVTKDGTQYTDFKVSRTDDKNYRLTLAEEAEYGQVFTVTVSMAGYEFQGTEVRNLLEEKLAVTTIDLKADKTAIQPYGTVTFTPTIKDQKGQPINPQFDLAYTVLDEVYGDKDVTRNHHYVRIRGNQIQFQVSGSFKVYASADGVESAPVRIKVSLDSDETWAVTFDVFGKGHLSVTVDGQAIRSGDQVPVGKTVVFTPGPGTYTLEVIASGYSDFRGGDMSGSYVDPSIVTTYGLSVDIPFLIGDEQGISRDLHVEWYFGKKATINPPSATCDLSNPKDLLLTVTYNDETEIREIQVLDDIGGGYLIGYPLDESYYRIDGNILTIKREYFANLPKGHNINGRITLYVKFDHTHHPVEIYLID